MTYLLLTGDHVFSQPNDLAVIWAHAREQPVRPTQARPELPAGVDRVVLRSLSKSPNSRHPSCSAFALDLAGALEPLARRHSVVGTATWAEATTVVGVNGSGSVWADIVSVSNLPDLLSREVQRRLRHHGGVQQMDQSAKTRRDTPADHHDRADEDDERNSVRWSFDGQNVHRHGRCTGCCGADRQCGRAIGVARALE